MKTRPLTGSLAALAAASLLGPIVLPAADAPAPAPAPPPPAVATPPRPAADAPAPVLRGGPERGPDRFGGVRAGVLDERQRELLNEAVLNHRDQLRRLEQQLAAAQREQMQAILAEKQDEKVIREKAEAVGRIQTELTLLRAKIFAAVAPTLKPEQREQLLEFPTYLNMIGGFGGFGGPRGLRGGFGPDAGNRQGRGPVPDRGGRLQRN